MGCGSDKLQKNVEETSKYYNYVQKKRDFQSDWDFIVKYNNKKLSEEMDKVKGMERPTQNDFHFMEKYKETLFKEGMNNPSYTIMAYVAKDRLSGLMKDPIKIFDYINENIKHNTKSKHGTEKLTEVELDLCPKIVERFKKEFEADLRHILYDVKDNYCESIFIGFNENLKFNPKFEPNIITLVISEKLFDEPKALEGVVEVIQYSQALQIINLIIYPTSGDGELKEKFGLDGFYYSSLYTILKAVADNRNIKVLNFHCIKDYGIMLAPEIGAQIIKKIQTETLVALHIGNLGFSEYFIEKLKFHIASTRKLLFLSLEGNMLKKMHINHLKNIISKNKSLLAISIVSSDFPSSDEKLIKKFKEEAFATKKETNKANKDKCKLSVIYVSDESIIKFLKNKHIARKADSSRLSLPKTYTESNIII